VFSWVSVVEHRETENLSLFSTKHSGLTELDVSDHAARTAIYAIDPATKRETRLGQLDGEGGVPVDYDAVHDVLWVLRSR
jgi:hypothetical protein